ncbi:MAG TPA: PHP domain-containing protein [Jatrophihabitantaceae bacterium]|nr:PHP domain-containing protein [Jatrophihabitantaceae bacterium]
MRIDLHTHSDASDGTDTPAQLVANARAAGLDVVAITDHDTTAGWDEAIAARPDGLTLVPGAEFSCRWQPASGWGRISLHLLGYLFDRDDIALRAERARLRETRLTRGRTMVERMIADGVPITWAQIEDMAGTGPVGRPHLGRALVAAGVVDSVDAAFAGPISSRSPYYEPKADTDVFTMIRLLRDAGGLPVFAHPIATRRGPTVSDEVVAEMAAAGLVGLEVDHPDHGPDDRARAAGLARDLGLVATGSSDYHGTNKTRNPLGACLTEPEAFEALLEHACAGEPVR